MCRHHVESIVKKKLPFLLLAVAAIFILKVIVLHLFFPNISVSDLHKNLNLLSPIILLGVLFIIIIHVKLMHRMHKKQK